MFSSTIPMALLTVATLAATSPAAATPAKDPIVAETIAAVCVGSSRNPVPQSLRIELTASHVRVSTQRRASCSSALAAVRHLGAFNRPPKGYTCTAPPLPPEEFTEHDVCVFTRAGTTVRLRFDLILD